MMNTLHETGYFKNSDGLDIFFQYWLPEKEHKANLLIIHGIGEHSGRYGNIVNELLPEGFAIFGLDHVGHGQSGGKRGHVSHFSKFADDVELFRQQIQKLCKGKPLFMLGNSMGGLILINYLYKFPENRLAGTIFSSPAFGISVKIPFWKKALGKILMLVYPSFTMGNGLNPDDLSHDTVVVDKYRKDELVHDRASAAMFFSMLDVIQESNDNADLVQGPVLMMLGEFDKIISKEGALQLFSKLGSMDKKSYICENAYHEIFNEIDKTKNLKIIYEWMTSKLIQGVKEVSV